MPTPGRRESKPSTPSTGRVHDVASSLVWLEAHATKATRDAMPRFGIVAAHALGVKVGEIRALAKAIGHDHDLAQALWATDVYEARLLACFVDDPARVTVTQMNAWCRDFDNWAVCDTACFHLFDHTPHALGRVAAWANRSAEFERRAAFALVASLALHRKDLDATAFVALLPLIETAASDPRNFVKKAVSWALRGVGRREAALHTRSLTLAARLAASSDRTERWVGKDALRELSSEAVVKRIAAKAAPKKKANAR